MPPLVAESALRHSPPMTVAPLPSFPDRARPVPEPGSAPARDSFFGYGSLVNLATHGHRPALPARLSGWRRLWQGTRLRRAAFLSVAPAPGSTIDGVLAVPADGWEALDRRERAYLWQPAAIAPLGTVSPAAGAPVLYRIDPDLAESGEHPILLSYLDCVLAGYHALFGVAGIDHFIATTDGWNRPLIDDRARPLYSRAQTLSPALTRLIDVRLDALGLRRIRP